MRGVGPTGRRERIGVAAPERVQSLTLQALRSGDRVGLVRRPFACSELHPLDMKTASEIRKAYDSEAKNYDKVYSHDMSPEALELYVGDLRDALGKASGRLALDAGCGNGAFTEVLVRAGYDVQGVDFSKRMLGYAKKRLPEVKFSHIKNLEKAVDFFSPESFDLIVSRQVACHFLDPIATFKSWMPWLKKSGRIAMIEGIYGRAAWKDQWGQFPDELPLACVETWATLTYMLQKSDYKVERKSWMHRVNGYEAVSAMTAGRKALMRYMVVARVP